MSAWDVKFAEAVLSGAGGQPANDETVIIGSKTYKFQTSLTNVDGNVAIGASVAASLANLFNAINLGPGAGTAYAVAMTKHPQVVAYAVTATTLTVRAAGAVGNAIAVAGTYDSGDGDWDEATLVGGEGNLNDALHYILRHHSVNAGAAQALLALTVEDD